ncbi:hypothetical protein BGW36DRAFT_429416 [Talaromyces proteolyticus]|uniref:Uncharacterized protein n=1 Tax=Talaromyces proteolyticus TaxID=1131652 RepID=A0AAD4KTF7_9EURO|nr:uncharacterized protein BGW36DRAFT_429416 [Talaromyces proteolyticus]KAH8695540.1 hypothetical protein BGW36DRAFT_429416 [Talaromyces proteolyticus]
MRIQAAALLSYQLILQTLSQVDNKPSGLSGIFQINSDSEFAFVLEPIMSLNSNHGGSTGEVLRAASQITLGDFESWYDTFLFLKFAAFDDIHNKAVALRLDIE